MKNSFEMEDYEVSLDDEEMNYSGNSSLIKNIQDNKMNNKKIFYLKHKCCMLQKNLNNFIDNYEQFIMDNVKKIVDLNIFFFMLLR